MHPPLYPENFRPRPPTGKLPRVNRRKVTMPTSSVGPYVKLVFAEMARLDVTYDDLEVGSGVRRATIKAWRKKNAPGLESLQAALGFLGHNLVPVPALEAMPPELAGDLTALALKMQRDIPTTFAAMVAVGVEQALLNMSIAERQAVSAGRTARRAKRVANDNLKPNLPARRSQRA